MNLEALLGIVLARLALEGIRIRNLAGDTRGLGGPKGYSGRANISELTFVFQLGELSAQHFCPFPPLGFFTLRTRYVINQLQALGYKLQISTFPKNGGFDYYLEVVLISHATSGWGAILKLKLRDGDFQPWVGTLDQVFQNREGYTLLKIVEDLAESRTYQVVASLANLAQLQNWQPENLWLAEIPEPPFERALAFREIMTDSGLSVGEDSDNIPIPWGVCIPWNVNPEWVRLYLRSILRKEVVFVGMTESSDGSWLSTRY